MTIKENTVGKSRFLRRPIDRSRIIDGPETATYHNPKRVVDIEPPDRVVRKTPDFDNLRTLVYDLARSKINDHETLLTFRRLRLPFGVVEVSYNYVEDLPDSPDLAEATPPSGS